MFWAVTVGVLSGLGFLVFESVSDMSERERTSEPAQAPSAGHSVTPDTPVAFGYSKEGLALAAIDISGDGFADICRTNLDVADGFHCLLNPAIEAGHWLIVRLSATASNRFGIGSRVEARAGDALFVAEVVTTTSAFTAVHPQVHFGLGGVTSLDSLIVRWPSGIVTEVADVGVDQVLTVTELLP